MAALIAGLVLLVTPASAYAQEFGTVLAGPRRPAGVDRAQFERENEAAKPNPYAPRASQRDPIDPTS